ncbi:G-protein coupled receptor family C group 6 member A-like [Genypterus blacodes]|uniref:G-protein coupled receptor family C group 6 member A-like n=1 Tax=Genypterus blacodes TaxID=154954 RepID=UPI003F762B2C
MEHCFSFYGFVSVLLAQVYTEQFNIRNVDTATAPGDIIIGGLFPIHESVDVTFAEDGSDTRTCNRFSTPILVHSLIMVQAVEEINRSHKLGNLTLGYQIFDSCADVTTALQGILSFMRRGKGEFQDNKCNGAVVPSPPVMAVIGDPHSELSIVVARQLNLEHIPQISYGATSGKLSDKSRFPNFMRTVPEDDHQADAIIQILKKNNWNWIGVVAPDGDYGGYVLQRLKYHAEKNNICVAFTSILPDALGDQTLMKYINNTIKSIIDNENVTVIVSFARRYHMEHLFDGLRRNPQARGKVWVASDNWSQSGEVLGNWSLNDVGTIIGITLKYGNTSKFEQYLSKLDPDPDNHQNNTFLQRFLLEHNKKLNQQRFEPNERLEEAGRASTTQGTLSMDLNRALKRVKQGKQVKPGESANEVLKKSIYPYAVFSVGMAVRAVAQAAADLCVNRDCKTGLQPLQFLRALQKATFDLDGQNYTFDNRGDLNTGYEIILWRQNQELLKVQNIVAYYSIQNKNITFTSPSARQEFLNLTGNVTSSCSESCHPGYVKQSAKGQPVCCYQCQACPENTFSNYTDSTECNPCDADSHYSKRGSAYCTQKIDVFLDWTDIFCDVLLAFTALGALLSIVAGIVFIARWNTPVVRASVGPISLLLLLSLLGTFVSVIIFVGRPNPLQCEARQVLFGLSFTLCISCILVKSYKIILAFEFDPNLHRVLKKLYKPYIIIGMCVSLQVVICALWLIFQPPKLAWDILPEKQLRLLECDERPFAAFGAMLSYIAFLALIGFGFAFKGRNLPNSYNEAKFITFGMLIYFISWIIFGPVYFTVKGKYLAAVEMVVILFSAYGILFCHFLPKCYIILCKKEANTVLAFRQDIRSFSMGDVHDEDKKDQCSSSS